ncbi:histidine kinase [Nocardia sp. bgisy118]|uniref:sensor histidine kinase n=1 Tax=Nocardia sp. bgisy118 TaxID=3413786 RepID=UPI003F49DB54
MSAPGIANRGSVVWDWGLAFIVAVVQLAGSRGANMHQTGTQSLDVLGYLLLLAGPIALLFRRTQPLPVLVVTLAACGIYLALGYGYGPIFLSLVIAFLTAATIGSRWWTYPLMPVGYAAFVWPLPALLGKSVNGWQIFGIMAWLIVLVGAAEGLRQRKVALEARRQRVEAARRDEQLRRERRATEERLAIARELHDVLAHSLSLINVQSSVALELFDKRPQQARTALAAIKAASKESLAEVHTLLETIRTGATMDDPEPEANSIEAARSSRGRRGVRRGAAGERRESDAADSGRLPRNAAPARKQEAPRAPAPSIADLDTLLQRARDAGLTVQTRVIGEPQKLPSVIDVAAARIIQESLTNVVRHAPGASATVTVRYAAGSVDLTIDNTRPTAPVLRSGSSGGNGIIGMRERAHALGGALTAGPRPSGGFRVAARLPSQTEPVQRPAPRPAEPSSRPAEPAPPATGSTTGTETGTTTATGTGTTTATGTATARNGVSADTTTEQKERNGSASASSGGADISSPGKATEPATQNVTASVADSADPNVRNGSARPVPDDAEAPIGPRTQNDAATEDTSPATDDPQARSCTATKDTDPATDDRNARNSTTVADSNTATNNPQARNSAAAGSDTATNDGTACNGTTDGNSGASTDHPKASNGITAADTNTATNDRTAHNGTTDADLDTTTDDRTARNGTTAADSDTPTNDRTARNGTTAGNSNTPTNDRTAPDDGDSDAATDDRKVRTGSAPASPSHASATEQSPRSSAPSGDTAET